MGNDLPSIVRGEMGKCSEVDFIHEMVARDTIIKCDRTVNLLWRTVIHCFRLYETVHSLLYKQRFHFKS